jgi:hypothetical protein
MVAPDWWPMFRISEGPSAEQIKGLQPADLCKVPVATKYEFKIKICSYLYVLKYLNTVSTKFKGIVSRKFDILFLVSFESLEVSTNF